MNRVLVTGAQGFIGRHLIERWLADSPEASVRGVGRSACRDTHGPRYSYARADVLDAAALRDVVHSFRPDVVIHLAAALKGDDPATLVRANVEGTATLMHVLAGAPERPVVVLGSSGAVYGESQSLPLTEDSPLGPTDSLYATSRRGAEEVARVLGRASGLDVRIARIFNPIGPGLDARHLPAQLAAQVAAIESGAAPPVVELAHRGTTRDFIDVRDVARALRCIALHPQAAGGTFNVGSGREVRIESLVEAFVQSARTLHPIRVRVREPASLKDAAAGVSRHVASVERLRALGFEPQHTLQDAVDASLQAARVGGDQAHDERTSAAPVRVEVVARFGYDVEVAQGLLDHAPARIRATLGARHAVLLSEPNVYALYGERALSALRSQGIDVTPLCMPAGEQAKSREVHAHLTDALHQLKFARRSLLVCLGGALVSDVGGFVASTFMRSVPYVNLPTTLLAQHDGAVGGKVAVNLPWAKNAMGAFHHPSGVYCDPEVLRTLDGRNLSAGIAESIKVALTGDAALFALLEDAAEAVLERKDPQVLEQIVRRSIAQKVKMLAPDPLEVDLRRALNLGHTLAHALETELEYQGLLHGEAVGFGLAVATLIGHARGLCSDETCARILRLLAAYHLPPCIPAEAARSALARLEDIRRVRGGALHFVAPVAIDAVQIFAELAPGELSAAVERALALPVSARLGVAA